MSDTPEWTTCDGCIYADHRDGKPMSAVAYPCCECRRNPAAEIVDHFALTPPKEPLPPHGKGDGR